MSCQNDPILCLICGNWLRMFRTGGIKDFFCEKCGHAERRGSGK